MDRLELIYDMLKDIKEQQSIDHDILLRHQQMSESNKRRLDIVEARAVLINWKTIGIVVGIFSGITGATYSIMKMMGL
jgi:hypothetical protein